MSLYRFRPTVPLRHAARSGARALVCVFFLGLLVCLQAGGAFAAVLRLENTTGAVPLAPYLDFLPDATAALRIDDAASASLADRYQPLTQGIPRDHGGPVWLRLALVKVAPSTEEDARLLLDLGRDLPGTTRLFSMRAGAPGGEAKLWQSEDSSAHVAFSLPAPSLVPATVYLRLDGPPSPWFSPVLRTAAAPQPSALPLGLLLQALLAAALLMSLLRALHEKVQWRFWAALLTGTALLQAFFPAGSAVAGPVSPKMLCSLLTPGLMLMLLPHVGRHLLQTPRRAPGPDLLLRLLPVLGAALALAPLAPGLTWLGRYLALWPVLLAPLFFVAAACLARRLPGALAFFAACLAPLLGAAASLLELLNAAPPLLGASGHIVGMTLGCLALALASPVREEAKKKESERDLPAPNLVWRDDQPPGPPDSPEEGRDTVAPAPQNSPADTELLNARAAVFPASENGALLDFTPVWDASTSKVVAPDSDPADALAAVVSETGEPCATPAEGDSASATRSVPLAPCPPPEAVHGEPAAAEQSADEPAATEDPAFMPGSLSGKEPDELPTPPYSPLPPLPRFSLSPPVSRNAPDAAPPAPYDSAPVNALPPLADEQPPVEEKHFFDLFRLLKETHASVAESAEEKGLGLAWHVSPHIAQYYEGEDDLLGEALTLLLRGAIRATDRGMVELTARGLPGNADPGHLVFALSIRGGGTAVRPWDITAVGRIWALADRCGGFFSLDHTQDGDMSVVFSMQFFVPGETRDPATEQELDAPLQPERTLPETAAVESLSASAGSAELFQPVPAGGPAVTALPPEKDEKEAAQEPEPWVRERIILADMAAGSRRLRAQYLSDLPHALLEADSVPSALALYSRNPSGLMILDADMPETDIAEGIAELRRLEAARSLPRTSTLALTAHELQSSRMSDAGCEACLVKPFSREQLHEVVLRLVPHDASVPLSPDLSPAAQAAPVPQDAQRDMLSRTDRETPDNPEETAPPSTPEREQEPPTALLSGAELAALGLDRGASSSAPEAALPATAEEPAPEHAAASARELPLLDLIITDITPDSEEPGEAPAAAEPFPSPAPEEPATVPEKPASLIVRVKPPARRPAMRKPTPVPAATPSAAPDASAPVPDASVPEHAPAREDAPQKPASRPVVRITSRDPKSDKIPLAGLSDSLYTDMLPFTPGLIHTLSDAVKDALRGQEEKSCLLVQDAAERLAGKASAFGLENLERMARCVERAAAADDAEAVRDLLGELVTLTERYKEALYLCHRDAR